MIADKTTTIIGRETNEEYIDYGVQYLTKEEGQKLQASINALFNKNTLFLTSCRNSTMNTNNTAKTIGIK